MHTFLIMASLYPPNFAKGSCVIEKVIAFQLLSLMYVMVKYNLK